MTVARRFRYEGHTEVQHLKALDDDVDHVEQKVDDLGERFDDEFGALRKALYTAALAFVVGFPTLAFAVVFAVSKIAGS